MTLSRLPFSGVEHRDRFIQLFSPLQHKLLTVVLRGILLSLLISITTPLHAAPLEMAAAPPAADEIHTFSVPAGPLDAALDHFAHTAGVNLYYDAALLSGLQSKGLSGNYSTASALSRLLAGSGIEAAPQPGGGYSLRRVAAGGSTVLPPITVSADTLGTTTEGTGSYATRNVTLFGGEQSLKDIPQSVTVITRQKIDDLRLDTLDKVLENTPGITLFARPGGGSDIYSRGFITNTIQYDGVPLQRGSFWGNPFAASSIYLDRVEVLRGAQGLLEGVGNPAGAVNVVRKRGLADTVFNIEGRIGSWSNYGTRLEAGGPWDEKGRLRSRAVLDYEDKESFIDTISDRNLNAYGALDLDITPDTTLGLGVFYSLLKGNSPLYRGVPRYADGRPLDIARSVTVSADWNDAKRRESQVFLNLEHRFSRDWKLKAAGVYIKEDWDAITSYGNGMVRVGSNLINGSGYAYDYSANNAGLDISLSGKFMALGMSHDLVFGGNYSRQKRNDGYVEYRNYMVYDVFNVNHNAPRLGTTAPNSIENVKRDIEQKGVYSMLRSHLTDQLTLIIGARASWYDQESNQISLSWGSSSSKMKKNGEFTPYAGLIYALTSQWSVYASYADIFQPQTATNAQLQTLKPIIGSNYEAGIKGELLNGALNTSFAVFRIDQKNRAVTDFDSPRVCGGGTSPCSRAAGEVRSEGFELEANGEILRGWQISGGYTYNRNKYLKDETASNIGEPFNYVMPRHMLRLWSDYKLSGFLDSWSVGAGVNYRSKQNTGTAGMQKNPIQGGYSVWNARVAYKINNNWSASLNINNVFDKHYFSYIEDVWHWSNFYGAPRNFILTMRGSF